MSTDTGVDLVAYASRKTGAKTIQVKSNLKPKPSGGKGRLGLDWWLPQDSPAELIALVDLSTESVWMYTLQEFEALAQQRSGKGHHLYMFADGDSKTASRERRPLVSEFVNYRLENRLQELFSIPSPRHSASTSLSKVTSP